MPTRTDSSTIKERKPQTPAQRWARRYNWICSHQLRSAEIQIYNICSSGVVTPEQSNKAYKLSEEIRLLRLELETPEAKSASKTRYLSKEKPNG